MVIVAYRNSSIALADEVVFLENGRLVAQGTHQHLMDTTPGYVRLLTAYEEDMAARAAEASDA